MMQDRRKYFIQMIINIFRRAGIARLLLLVYILLMGGGAPIFAKHGAHFGFGFFPAMFAIVSFKILPYILAVDIVIAAIVRLVEGFYAVWWNNFVSILFVNAISFFVVIYCFYFGWR